jgi:hypothetical protein
LWWKNSVFLDFWTHIPKINSYRFVGPKHAFVKKVLPSRSFCPAGKVKTSPKIAKRAI